MNNMTRNYPESQFGGFTDVDGTIAFYIRLRALLQATDTALDIGCGRGAYGEDPVPIRRELRILTGACTRVIGIDVDPQAKINPFIDEFRLLGGQVWPVDDQSIDLAVSDNTLEHVADIAMFFRECQRVIRPGGYLCIRTPNVLSYVGLLSRLIPNRLHGQVLSKVQQGRKDADIFPTLYRCNTRRALSRMLTSHEFEHHVYGYEAEPSYLAFSPLAYRLGVLHQRLAPNCLKPALFAFAKKR